MYNKQHAPCVQLDPLGQAEVNLSLFHAFVDVDANVEEPVPFASHT